MMARVFTFTFVTATILLPSFVSRADGQGLEPPTEPTRRFSKQQDSREQRLYPVADLVLPISQPGDCTLYNLVKPVEPPKKAGASSPVNPPENPDSNPTGPPAPVKTIEDDLIKVITTTIEPENWAGRGGSWTLAYHADTKTLVVNAPAPAHGKVEDLLTGLRRQQNQEVCVELRLISVSDAMMDRLGLAPPKEENNQSAATPAENPQMPWRGMVQRLPRVTFMDQGQVSHFIRFVQEDPGASVMQAPKMTLFNGQAAKFTCADTQHFVTRIEPKDVNGQKIFVPVNELFPTSGYSFSIQPAISADRRFVSLNLQANLTHVQSPNILLYPVTTFVTPVFEGGALGQPVPFTQYLQQPAFNTIQTDRRLNIPDGGTALLSGWRQVKLARNESAVPVLGSIPYIDRLFKNVSYSHETANVMLMVTPHIIIGPEPEDILAQDRTKLQNSGKNSGATEQETVQALLANYRKACSEGRKADARELAAKALSLDPACFSNR